MNRDNEIKLTENAKRVLEKRYLAKNDKGEVVETPKDLFRRVAKNIAKADKLYDKKANLQNTEEEFYKIIANLEFLPNSPTLMNAGRELQQLSACFVLPISDSMNSIFETIKDMAMIQKSGGGTGFSFSRLRPKNSTVKSTGGIASGPVSFLKVFNAATQAVIQGGTRRGANMGILRIDHPDILEFIKCKESDKEITNFNISVTVTEDFMKKVIANEDYDLIDPHTKKHVGKLNAKEVFDLIIKMAWKNGEPGIIFLDRMNKFNPTPELGEYESTNPCVTGDTFVSTEFGLMKIKDIARKYGDGGLMILTDDRVIDTLCVQSNNSSGGLMVQTKPGVSLNTISRAWKTGIKPTFKLTTKTGYELVATGDHRVMTTEGWVQIRNLIKGRHKILIQSESENFNKDDRLPFNFSNVHKGKNGRISRLNFPRKWTRELGQILGWLIGDGWIMDKRNKCVAFSFGKKDREVLNHLKPILNEMNGNEVKGIMRPRDVFHLAYHSKYIVEFFKKLGVKVAGADEKEVPGLIFSAPKEAVIGFLQGLFSADGTVRDNPKANSSWVALSSKSKKLLQGVQLLLLNLGIKSTIFNRSRKKRDGMFRYIDTAGKERTYSSDGVLYEIGIFGASRERFRKKINFINSYKKKKLENIRFKGFREEKFIDKILSIKYVGMNEVYDLTEPLTHSMIVNGMVTHQCGEQILLPFESCNLGSINLSKMITDKKIDWDKLAKTTKTAVHFLDNVVDMNRYPLKKIKDITKANRKIGLGVMGFADMLIKLGVRYNSEEGLAAARKVMGFILKKARKASRALAKKRGAFPNFEHSIYGKSKEGPLRNATLTTIAPTGSLSIIAGCSSGVEPLFAVSYTRKILDNERLVEVNPYFKEIAEERGFFSPELMKLIADKGSIKEIDEIPQDVKELFVTSHDILAMWHIKMQAVFQEYTDNAVSKTVNFPQNATEDDVRNVYMMAHKLGCKGVTIYRDKSREEQVLNIENNLKKQIEASKIIPRPRPTVTTGTTTKVATGCGNLYITINEDEQHLPFEVFMQMGKAGGCAMSQLEAIGRLVSLALRSGIDINSIIEQLKGIRCPNPSWEKGGRIFSCSDAIARVIERRLVKAKEKKGPKPARGSDSKKAGPDLQSSTTSIITKKKLNNIVGVCPDCGAALYHVEGCNVCNSCGYSTCG